jgi:hypothetical protein
VPRNCQGVPRNCQGVPRNCQGVPRNCQGVPRNCQDVGVPFGVRASALGAWVRGWRVRLALTYMQCNHNYMTTDSAAAGSTGSGSAEDVLRGWFTGRLPSGWFTAAPEIKVDREEITIVGTLADPEIAADSTAAESAAAADGRSRRFREETRDHRIEIAREAEHKFGRKVSWGVECAGRRVMFTTFSVPVMTRLRQSERQVLDTLVDGGVARSRSDALAWCVRLVGEHQDTWLADLRAALRKVEQVRADGPDQ